MTEPHKPAIRPVSATLRYKIESGRLDPHDLGQVVERIHGLVYGDLPGDHIKSISYDGFDLTIEVKTT